MTGVIAEGGGGWGSGGLKYAIDFIDTIWNYAPGGIEVVLHLLSDFDWIVGWALSLVLHDHLPLGDTSIAPAQPGMLRSFSKKKM